MRAHIIGVIATPREEFLTGLNVVITRADPVKPFLVFEVEGMLDLVLPSSLSRAECEIAKAIKDSWASIANELDDEATVMEKEVESLS